VGRRSRAKRAYAKALLRPTDARKVLHVAVQRRSLAERFSHQLAVAFNTLRTFTHR
jgi:hypothetical protein